jgi:ferric-dicitrate binding protein FerR (iron transport regulator)
LLNPDYIEDLIAKTLSGEASASELDELNAWLGASLENRKHFEQAQKLIGAAESLPSELPVNTDAAWDKVRAQLHANRDAGKIRNRHPRPQAWSWLRVAAMIVLLAGSGYGIYHLLNRETIQEEFIASTDVPVTRTLPDSTEVVLNRHSKIEYAFSKEKRQVTLTGEAYFDLAPDPGRPFEVQTGALTIRDIGTAFNVQAMEGGDTVLVYVATGEVILMGKSGTTLRVAGGDRAAYIRSRDELLELAMADTNALSWKTKVFVFENAGLESVAQKISEVYGIHIEVAESARSCRITATFVNETVDNMIDIIAETLQITVRRENDRVILEGGACVEQ